MHPLIALMIGDRHGVGSELVARLVSEGKTVASHRIVVTGDPAAFAFGCNAAAVSAALPVIASLDEAPAAPGQPVLLARPWTQDPAVGKGQVSAAAGAEVLDNLGFLLDQAHAGRVNGIVFGPLNKQAMRLGGLPEGDELDFAIERLDFRGPTGELNVLGDLWTSRVTSHVPLRAVADLITPHAVGEAIRLIHRTLVATGLARPRIAVAGLNPHAGDGGIFGDEEIRVIGPAVEAARAEGIDAAGPFPADTIFVTAQRGGYDAVVTMYHDQGQIALKLLQLGSGVTVLAGLPVPVTTVGHGTAFDIVGLGRAKPDGLRNALEICGRMARSMAR